MSTLSKKTKGQLIEIAEELDIDLADCKVKKEVYEAVKDYFVKNAEDFDENSKFYELATISKLGSNKKSTVYVEGEDGQVEEVDVIIEDDSNEEDVETEEAESSEEAGEVDEDDFEDSDEDDEDDLDFECYTNLVKAIQHGTVKEYIELKNYEIRDCLADPYTINEISFGLESAFLLYSLASFTTIDAYLPSTVSSYLPNVISNLPVLSKNSFTITNAATALLWYLSGNLLPVIFSYMVNFTYDFNRDAFTEALAKLFIAILVFKTDLGYISITDEVKYKLSFGNAIINSFKHFSFAATLNLRDIFGNWVLLNALFTSILALYANLAFV